MSLPNFNSIDQIALSIILIGTLIGFRRGLTGQVAILLGALLMVATLVNGYTPCQGWLINRFAMPEQPASLLAVGIVIAGPLLVVWVFNHLAALVMRVTFMAWADRLGGAVAGFASATAFVVLMFVLLSLLPREIRPRGLDHESWIGRNLVGVEGEISEKIKTRIKEIQARLQRTREIRTEKRERWEE